MTHPEQVASKKPRFRGFFFVRLLNPGANLMSLAFFPTTVSCSREVY